MSDAPDSREETRCQAPGDRPDPSQDRVRELVLSFLERAGEMSAAAGEAGTPVYVLEAEVIRQRVETFLKAFSSRLPGFEAFFAMKCNNSPEVAREVVGAGLGLDVSSGLELAAALQVGCRRILFSGPGKTEEELALAAANADRVTVLLDSFQEMGRLNEAALEAGSIVTAGVRLTTQEEGLWRKFGVPPAALESFMIQAADRPAIRLEGLQFHTSWNLTPDAQTSFIARLGGVLKDLDPALRESLSFLDIGGGFWPGDGEWLLAEGAPGPPEGLPRGRRIIPAAPIVDFAREIAAALSEHVFPTGEMRVYAEPGRWIVNDALHIIIRVADKKAQDMVITDAGTNIVGWERYETDYVPVINLSRPSLTERPCLIAGSLCTPHDVWGWSYFGEGIEPGDLLLLPRQGAYTWSLRQQFIKPLAGMVRVPRRQR
ncbi:MAG: alanine racemase [bacterium]|nr:MAG: alanine racemase [bacterium]